MLIQGLSQVLKPALIFVLYLDNQSAAQELSYDLPGSYEMEEIFHSGSAHPLKIRVGFCTGDG
jgi:hypothetical protein